MSAGGERQSRRGARLRRLAGRDWFTTLGADAHEAIVETVAGPAQYVVAGNGPPVVLLHGLDGSARWWAPTIHALAPHFRCYALEFVRFDRWRERGRVPLPRTASFAAAWLAALGIERAGIVGHSLGGQPACQIAIEHPELVGHLVLIAPAILPLQARGTLASVGLVPFLARLAPAFIPVLLADAVRTGPLRWLRTSQELLTAPALQLSRIAAPTLLIWGDDDPLLPVAQAATIQQQIPDSRLLRIPGARHIPMYEQPETCNQAIAQFLRE